MSRPQATDLLLLLAAIRVVYVVTAVLARTLLAQNIANGPTTSTELASLTRKYSEATRSLFLPFFHRTSAPISFFSLPPIGSPLSPSMKFMAAGKFLRTHSGASSLALSVFVQFSNHKLYDCRIDGRETTKLVYGSG